MNLPSFSGIDMAAALKSVRAGDLKRVQAELTEPARALVDQVLDQALPTRAKAQFLLKNADFVKAQLMEVFERFEGPSACVDKAEWVYGHLLRRFLSHPAGKDGAVDLRGIAGTMPLRVLRTGPAMLEAFRSIERLYYGKAFDYMEWLSRVGRVVQAQESSLGRGASSCSPMLH